MGRTSSSLTVLYCDGHGCLSTSSHWPSSISSWSTSSHGRSCGRERGYWRRRVLTEHPCVAERGVRIAVFTSPAISVQGFRANRVKLRPPPDMAGHSWLESPNSTILNSWERQECLSTQTFQNKRFWHQVTSLWVTWHVKSFTFPVLLSSHSCVRKPN